MRFLAAGLIAVLAWTTVPAPAKALDNPLDAVPDTAGVVIRLKNSKETTTKLIRFINQVDPSLGFLAGPAVQGVGVLISNPTLEGVDKEGDWWVAVFPHLEHDPAIVFGIPALDAEKLERAVGTGYHFAKDGKWVFYSEDEDALAQVQKRLDGEGQSISTRIDEESRAVMDRGDVSAFANLVVLKDIYDERIDTLEQQAQAIVEQLKVLSGSQAGAAFEMYGHLLQTVMQGVEDARGAAAGLSIGEANLHLEQYWSFEPDSDTAGRLAKHPPGQMSRLTRLPAGQLGYFGFHGDMRSLMDVGLGVSKSMIANDEESREKWDEIQKELKELEYGSSVSSLGLGDAENGALRSVTVTEVKPADKFRDISRKSLAMLGTIEREGLKQTVTFQQDAEKYGAHSADLVTIKQEVDERLDPAGMQKKLFGILFGPEGLTQRIVYLDDKVVQTIGGGKEEMEAALKAVEESGEATAGTREKEADGSVENAKSAEKSPEKAGSELADTRSRLAESANLLGLVDLPNAVTKGLMLVEESGIDLPLNMETLKRLRIARSYLGISVATEPHAVRAKVDVPAKQLTGVLQLATLLQSLRASQPVEEASR